MATQYLHRIHAATGFETFINGGSWVLMVVQKAIDLIFENDTTYQLVQLKANDIDLYHGEFTIEDKNLTVDSMNAIDYKKAVEQWLLTLEVNTVQCRNFSAKNFLQNNAINVTASFLHVDFSKDELFELHVAPQFLWKFLFDQNVNRKVSPISMLGVQNATCVRIAFKAFEMGIPFEFGAGGDPTNGTLATSQKEKIDAMQMWDGNPSFVHDYNIKKINNHYRMQKKVAREQCTKCKSRYINSRCTLKLCSQCCVERTTNGGPCRKEEMQSWVKEQKLRVRVRVRMVV